MSQTLCVVITNMQFVSPESALQYMKISVNVHNKAVIIDIDDTVIYYRNNMWFRAEVMFDFYEHLLNAGAKVYFVTARPHSASNLNKTLQQLRNFGFRQFEGLFLMQRNGKTSASEVAWFKSVIRNAIRIGENIPIVMNIGNQWHDLVIQTQLCKIPNLSNERTFIFRPVGEDISFAIKLPSTANLFISSTKQQKYDN